MWRVSQPSSPAKCAAKRRWWPGRCNCDSSDTADWGRQEVAVVKISKYSLVLSADISLTLHWVPQFWLRYCLHTKTNKIKSQIMRREDQQQYCALEERSTFSKALMSKLSNSSLLDTQFHNRNVSAALFRSGKKIAKTDFFLFSSTTTLRSTCPSPKHWFRFETAFCEILSSKVVIYCS